MGRPLTLAAILNQGGGAAIDSSEFKINGNWVGDSAFSTDFGDGVSSNKTFSVMGGFFGDRAKWPSHCMTTLWLPPPIVAAGGNGRGSGSGIDGSTGVGEVNIPPIEIRLNRNPQRRKDIKGVKWRERTVSVFYGKEIPVDHQYIDLGPQGSLKISGYTMNVNIEGLRARTVDVGGRSSNRRER